MKRATVAHALALTLSAATGVAGQIPDSLVADSSRAQFELPGFTVGIVRVTSTTGGASAVELRLDSLGALPAPTMEQVFRDMPLLVVRTNSRGEAQPALRGSEDRQVAILMDGVPLTLGWDHRSDLSVIPLTAARGVTLIRGLSSVLHGPNVLGGVVEVEIAKGPGRQPDPDPLILDASTDHVGGRALGVTGGQLIDGQRGQWVIRGGAGYQERPGFALPGGLASTAGMRPQFLTEDDDLRLNSDVRRFDGFVSARYQRDGGAWFSMSSSAFTTERGVPPESHLDDPRLWRYADQDRVVAAFSGGTGTQSTGGGEGDLEASIGIDFGSNRIDAFETEAFQRIEGDELGDGRTLTFRLLGDHTMGSSADVRAALTYADVAHDETLDGLELSQYRQRLWSLGTEVERRFQGLLGLPGVGSTRVSLGVALDGADTPESGDKLPLGTLWAGGVRLGFSSLLTDRSVRVHGGVSRRSRFPALRELYSGALGRFVPNPDLEPEVLTGGELGFTWSASEGELQMVGFHQRISDAIVRTTIEDQGVSKFQRVNRDEVRSTGLEVLAATAWGPMTLGGDLTVQQVRGYPPHGTSRDLEYEPTAYGKLTLGGKLPQQLIGSARLRFTSEQLCENPEAGGLVPFSTDPNVDLSIRRRFNARSGGPLSRIEASLSVDNVGDAAVFDQCGLPQPGRTFRVQLRLW